MTGTLIIPIELGNIVQCPECKATFPTGPAVCPVCAEIPPGECGSNDPGEDVINEA